MLVLVTLAEVGGAQTYVADLIPALTDDYEVTVAAHGDGPLAARVEQHGAAFVPLRFVRREISPLDVAGLVEVWRLCRRLRPELVHANSSKAGVIGRLAAYLARVPHRVFTSHGWAFAAAEGRSERLYRIVERMLNRVTSAVICVSEREHARGIEAGACSTGRAYVIPNAVDTARFGPGSDMRDAPTVEVVSVGRLAAPKDFSTLVAAVGELPRGTVTLRIVGDGPARASLEDLVAHLGLADCVRFDGTVSDIAPILAESDIFVLSSRSEGMPMSVLEAMAAGLPVVATDVGGLRELVDDENGRIVPPGDRVAMAAMIAELAADGSLRRRLGAAGRQRAVTRFSLSAWRDRHRELYARLIHGLSGGHMGQLT